MAGPRQQQRGMALILVMILLTGSLMLGLTALTAGLINERSAGNYRMSAQAQMVAESVAVEISDYLLQRERTPDTITSPLRSLPFHEALNKPVSEWVGCRDNSPWGGDAASRLNLESGQAWVVPCRKAGDTAHILVEGRTGDPINPAVFSAIIDLAIPAQGLAAVNFIGGIDDNADIQWPSSSQSRMRTSSEQPAIYFHYLDPGDFPGHTTHDKAELIGSMGDTSRVMDGDPEDAIVQARPNPGELGSFIGLLQAIHDTCASIAGGCDNIKIVSQNGSGSPKGNTVFDGLYINLAGELDLRDNTTIRGSAIVANVDIREEDGSWTSRPNKTIALAGGDNPGSILFDAANVTDAVNELKKIAPERFADLDVERFWSGNGMQASGSFQRDGWITEFW
ncbi:pilus assembly PilX family protein [Billgrantia endophytica]|uniref:Type 4 fimbrial biogenesis protein PilX N-terminal domain-containing protein n=1 Tax=Billgrantia endophytica TaxID=2033802 RepID=A0A2N7TZC1_9GAMM|nr:pilus assembly PilX N-terminal domain-containing protein [Halomonas endophytica]PMR73525.1 hypothetical protein C1H69_17065 [Halomonas endophytica]